MKKAMTIIIAAMTALFILSTTTFAAGGEKDLSPAIWTDGAYIYTADVSGEVCVFPCEPTLTDIGSAVMVDENGVYTAAEDGAVRSLYITTASASAQTWDPPS